MKHYIERIRTELSQRCPDGGEERSMLDMLYILYRERRAEDTAQMQESFAQLNTLLGSLPPRERDAAWDVSCALCAAQEERAFFEGIRLGMGLMEEGKQET